MKLVWTVRGVVHEDWIGGYVSLGVSDRIAVKVAGENIVGLTVSRAILQQ